MFRHKKWTKSEWKCSRCSKKTCLKPRKLLLKSICWHKAQKGLWNLLLIVVVLFLLCFITYHVCIFLYLQVLRELPGIYPQRFWERTHMASQWTYGPVVSHKAFSHLLAGLFLPFLLDTSTVLPCLWQLMQSLSNNFMQHYRENLLQSVSVKYLCVSAILAWK